MLRRPQDQEECADDSTRVVPLGHAELHRIAREGGSVLVGARCLRLGPLGAAGERIELSDALTSLSASWVPRETERATRPRAGDWVRAELRAGADGWHCVAASVATATVSGFLTQVSEAGVLARSRVLRALRGYFEEEEFVETPTPSFGVCPGLDSYVHSLSAVRLGTGEQHLMTSPELFMKRLLVRGLPRIYQIAAAFRAEELGQLHEPEFTLLEWYRSFAGQEEILLDIEEVVKRAAESLRPGEPPCLFVPPDLLAQPTPGGAPCERRRIPVDRPFERLTVREAFAEFAGVSDAVGLSLEAPERYFQLLVDRVEPGLARWGKPVFLTNYPKNQAALAQLSTRDPDTALRFELSVAGVELCNGYVELTDGQEQRQRFERERARRARVGEPNYPLDEKFLAALAEGLPPCTGVALGLDRLLTLAAGFDRVQQSMAFAAVDH